MWPGGEGESVPAESVRQAGPNKSLPLLLVGALALISGCAATVTSGGSDTRALQTTGGAPVRITRVPVSHAVFHKDVQVANGLVWATAPGIFSQKTVKFDPKTHEVTELERPFSTAGADLLVNEHAIWLSDTLTPTFGSGDLRRIALDSNETVATMAAVGYPFATAGDVVWAYNHLTGVASAIGIGDNRVRTKVATYGRKDQESMTFGAGSLWQFTFDAAASNLTVGCKLPGSMVACMVPTGRVSRIDPRSGKVVAELSLGNFLPTDRISYVAGSIWLLGEKDASGAAVAARIDVATNRVVAQIQLPRYPACVKNIRPRTAVEWQGAVWLSTYCTAVGRAPGRLLKIDLQRNEVVDQLLLTERHGHRGGQPDLAAGEGAIWGLDGRSVLRIDFK